MELVLTAVLVATVAVMVTVAGVVVVAVVVVRAVIVMALLVSVVAVATGGEVLGEVAGMAEVVTDVGSTEC